MVLYLEHIQESRDRMALVTIELWYRLSWCIDRDQSRGG